MSLKVKNWARFQHYKQRRPPWIKLHREILDDRDFMCLPFASMALAPCIWLLASEGDGTVPDDPAILAFRLHRTEVEVTAAVQTLIGKGFLEGRLRPASAVLAERAQSACLETETETETETERKTDYVDSGDITPLVAAQEVFDYWRKQTKRHAKWTKPRRGFLEARLREEDGTMAERVAALKLAVDGALLDPWFNGSESGRVFLDFDNIFRNKGRDRIEKLQEVARRAKAGEPPPDREDPLPPEESGARELWASVKIELATTLPAHTHRTWFSPTFGHGWLAGLEKTLVVRVPSEEHRKMLRDTFGVQIKEILATHGVKLLQLAVKELQ